ncbi:uncharacterized protein LOC144233808 [Crocuta crocuta]
MLDCDDCDDCGDCGGGGRGRKGCYRGARWWPRGPGGGGVGDGDGDEGSGGSGMWYGSASLTAAASQSLTLLGRQHPGVSGWDPNSRSSRPGSPARKGSGLEHAFSWVEAAAQEPRGVGGSRCGQMTPEVCSSFRAIL